MSTNKVYGDNPNILPLVEKKTRWEIKNSHKYKNGIDESMSLDNCTHSFFGTSKAYADLVVQEYGKNVGLKTSCFRAGCITGPNHSGAKLHGFLSYLVKSSIKNKKYTLIGYKGKQVRDNIHSHDLVNCFWEYFKKPKNGEVYNVGFGKNITINYLAQLISKKIIHTKKRIGEARETLANIKKLKKLNWSPKIQIEKGIKLLLNEKDYV